MFGFSRDRNSSVLPASINQCFHRPNIAMKLFLLPILCIFSALRSKGLGSSGIGGIMGLLNVGLATLLPGIEELLGTNDSLGCRLGNSFRLTFLCMISCVLGLSLCSGLAAFCSLSICPSSVVPPVARYSSGIPRNFMIPRSGRTPSDDARNDCMSAALRLFVVGRTSDGRALMVRM